MASLIELNKQGEILRRDLEAIEADLLTANTALQRAVMNPATMDETAAGAIAGRVALLEARRLATVKAIEQNGRELQKLTEFMNSKEYKQAQKQLAELNEHFAREAAEIRKAVTALRDRALKTLNLQGEYKALRQQTGDPMQAPPVDVLNLLTTYQALEREVRRYQSIDAAEAQTARLIAARKNTKPARLAAPAAPIRPRQTASDGTPIQV